MRIGLVLFLLMVTAPAASAVEVELIYLDDPGEGVYDVTPCAPTCDNSGDTLGEQRRIALQYAVDFIGARLISIVPIRIAVDFRASLCTPSNAVLATAGAVSLVSEFAGAPRSDTFYPIALANALAGKRLIAGANDIDAQFNSALDMSDTCLGGRDWYYGLDRKTPEGGINFISTAIHEFVHGLGFQSFVILSPNSPNGEVGQFLSAPGGRLPDVFSRHIRDLSLPGQPLWPELTARERAESATHAPYLVWDGNTTNSAASVLSEGIRQGRVRLYAPEPIEAGSSVSHWASAALPDQLMEPFVTTQPIFNLGLAACALQDMGWRLSSAASGCSASGGSTGGSSGDGSGGGCTLNPDAGFDPVLPFLIVMASGVLLYRRRAWRSA